jgi:hypothetical protein
MPNSISPDSWYGPMSAGRVTLVQVIPPVLHVERNESPAVESSVAEAVPDVGGSVAAPTSALGGTAVVEVTAVSIGARLSADRSAQLAITTQTTDTTSRPRPTLKCLIGAA